MEVEMESENEVVSLPPDIEIIREVTYQKEYKNFALAKSVPQEII